MSNKWGYCGEGCPREDKSTWTVDETLRITTHFFFDREKYIAIFVLGIMATSLLNIAAGLIYFGNLK